MKKTLAAILSAAILTLLLTACGSRPVILPKDGTAEGALGDTMRTYFFDYSVENAYTCSKYEGYIPTPGYDLLVAEITVKNTFGESLTMFDWDFLVLFPDGTEGEEVYDYPITSYEDVEVPSDALDTLLPSQYDLENDESRTGLLLFEVPAGETKFTISYIESFDDDTTGDVFYVDVDAPHK